MTINFHMPQSVELKPRIVVIGVGGAGGNAVNNMIGAGLDGVDFVVANTDAQALALNAASRKVQMGSGITQGLGAGMRPEVGEPARDRGILTVGIVTKPFMFEGSRRMKLADQGIENLYAAVDTMITIPNQNLFRVATEQTTMSDAFSMADEVLHSGVRGVTDLMVVPGLINLDFNDVRTVMDEMGKAMMGTGEATGERRAVEAAESAINNPLLDDVSLKGAKGVLINITGGRDLTLYEVDEAAQLIRNQVDENANIIVGSALDHDLDGIVRVSVVATGVDAVARTEEKIDPVKAPIAKPVETAKVVELGVHERAQEAAAAEAKARKAFEDYEFDREEEAIAVNAPPPYVAPKPYPPRIQPENSAAPTAPAPAPIPEATPPSPARNPFGFFGRRKTAAPAPAPRQVVKSRPAPSGDLFGSDTDDELEIPSFLRRQNR